ncbi:helix-turn-helix domain-containing protein [Cupriavidus numazuensis]|uniref:HTH-type transcriptional activator RhaR n=1 Tax=Cupriavidus numazuensis TaxID=221992 RepID=A0ABM8TW22_9BURK|nr:AraC family transcriptional regulator [Cupriavidus numazuensis]CAG2160963.1 HTH-type transcriptional activator RhaR [Cupriavidus numazuensis]
MMQGCADINPHEVREVGGELISSLIVDSEATRLEILTRRTPGQVVWRFCQPQPALFWWRRGAQGVRLQVDGHQIHSAINPKANMALFPAGTSIEGEFDVGTNCDYTAVFFKPSPFLAQVACRLDRPLVGFADEDLQRGLDALCRESRNADSLYELFSEGWAMQAVALLARIGGQKLEIARQRGGLAPAKLKRVIDYVGSDLSRSFTIDELAHIAGISPRHFIRSFQESVGQTPLRFINGLRVEQAKQLLVDRDKTTTEVAQDCGFSHAQHFSTAFKKATGVTPSEFRRATML